MPAAASNNPLRKQTLLGIAPVIPPRSEPPAAATPAAPATPSSPPADNPLRKQTLLGIAPVIPERHAEPAKPEATAPVHETAASAASIVTPAVAATDAPTTSEVAKEAAPRTKPTQAEPARPIAPISSSDHDVSELQARSPRWLLPVGVAAAIGLTVVGLRSLDHPPTPMPEELSRPITKARPHAKAGESRPKSDDGDDDDDDDSNTGNAPTPTPPDPEPLKAAAAPPATAAVAPPTTGAVPAASAAAPASAPGTLAINVVSDPPGARMFWKGKEVGTTPFVLQFPSGERHAYELGLPGYTTRKVVIDGSKTEISVGLQPDPGSGFGSSH